MSEVFAGFGWVMYVTAVIASIVSLFTPVGAAERAVIFANSAVFFAMACYYKGRS